MQKIKILKPINGYKKDEVVVLPNNDAHTLIDKGYATTDTKKYKTKDMVAE